MKHNFPPQQTEAILNAVSEFVDYEGGLFNLAQFVNDLSRMAISGKIEENQAGNLELSMNAGYLSEILINTTRISDFFQKLESTTKLM